MLKSLVSIFVIVLLCGCGVDTSSNSVDTKNSAINTNLDVIDPNPITGDTGTTTGDTNTTTSDTNTTNETNTSNGTGTEPESIFNTIGAVFDANACNAAKYRTARDASYNGDASGENGSGYFVVNGQGLQIKSDHQESSPDKSYKTWVTLFYKSYPDATNLGLQSSSVSKLAGVFSLIYDLAWAEKSILGIDNTLYVQSVINEKPDCYRLVLDSIYGTENKIQKVYR